MPRGFRSTCSPGDRPSQRRLHCAWSRVSGVTAGTFIGVPILGRIPDSAYRPLVGALLLVLGIGMFAAAL